MRVGISVLHLQTWSDPALFAVQVEWHEDLKKVLKMAGEANKRVVFLFADTQIKSESFVEDISNLLNTYEVPNLLQPADLATTFENIRPRAKAAGLDANKDQLYTFFLQEVTCPTHLDTALPCHAMHAHPSAMLPMTTLVSVLMTVKHNTRGGPRSAPRQCRKHTSGLRQQGSSACA